MKSSYSLYCRSYHREVKSVLHGSNKSSDRNTYTSLKFTIAGYPGNRLVYPVPGKGWSECSTVSNVVAQQLREAALKLTEAHEITSTWVQMYLRDRRCSDSRSMPVYCIRFPVGSALLACLQGIQSTSYKYISDLALDYFECGCALEAAGCPLLHIWCRVREGELSSLY